MSPVEKAAISRHNGQLSEGPTSAAGKQIVSRNALKHGFASETIPVKSEEREAYSKTLHSWVDQLKPEGPVELTLVERVCRNSWKLNKIAEREDELIDRLVLADDRDDETTAALDRELKLLARYEQAAERNFHKALNAFLKLRKNPELLTASAPKPSLAPAPKPTPRPAAPLVIPPAPNKPSFSEFLNPILNVTAARPPIVNAKNRHVDLM